MTKDELEDMALDAADAWCKCEETDHCEADGFREGFIAGALMMREEAAEVAAGEILLDVVPPGESKKSFASRLLKAVAKAIRTLGEDSGSPQVAEREDGK